MPEAVPAAGTGASWSIRVAGGAGVTGDDNHDATPFMSQNFQSGGMGGHPHHDGMSATAFPSGVRAIAVEVIEATTPLLFWRRELRMDSSGAGKYRGGLGQSIEVVNREKAPFVFFAMFQRVAYPAGGRNGGDDGAVGKFYLESGEPLGVRGVQRIPSGDRLVIEMPGGGGFGNPSERDPAMVLDDVVNGLVSAEKARKIYKVAISDDQTIDEQATQALRQAG
jgi:N-methylhydantoinase B